MFYRSAQQDIKLNLGVMNYGVPFVDLPDREETNLCWRAIMFQILSVVMITIMKDNSKIITAELPSKILSELSHERTDKERTNGPKNKKSGSVLSTSPVIAAGM
eukprot:243426_1